VARGEKKLAERNGRGIADYVVFGKVLYNAGRKCKTKMNPRR